eukprot:216367-Amphidinium_carterae.1
MTEHAAGEQSQKPACTEVLDSKTIRTRHCLANPGIPPQPPKTPIGNKVRTMTRIGNERCQGLRFQ